MGNSAVITSPDIIFIQISVLKEFFNDPMCIEHNP